MKKVQYLFIQAAVCLSLLVACGGDNDDAITNPLDVAFTGFSPQTAFIGDEVTLQGNNLGTEPRALLVTFGGVPAEVVRAAETSATVIVPDDIEASSAVIELRANLASLKSAKAFTLKAPEIESNWSPKMENCCPGAGVKPFSSDTTSVPPSATLTS